MDYGCFVPVPGNETTTQRTFVPGNERVNERVDERVNERVDVLFSERNCLVTFVH